MNSKKILVIDGHPRKNSLCAAFAQEYADSAASAGHDVRTIHVRDIKPAELLADPLTPPSKSIKSAQKDLLWAEHLVFSYPTWWSAMPGMLKSFIEHVLASGVAYKYSGSALPARLLKGKSARVFVTMDGPKIFFRLFLRSSGNMIIGRASLRFCGVHPVRFSIFDKVKKSTTAKRKKWIKRVRTIGARGV